MEVKWCERHYKVGVHSKKNNGYVLTGNAKANPVLNENDLYLKILYTYGIIYIEIYRRCNMEEWRNIKGFEGCYMVSNLGRVKRMGFYRNQSSTWEHEEKILKAGDNGRGYLFVNLSMNNKQYHRYVHRLVAEAFIPNPENKATVNHIDCNRHNNNVKNLEWATYRENNDYALKVMREQGENKRNNKASKPIIQYDLEMNFIAEYPSVREAERQLGYKGICACLVGKQKTVHGHIFKYKQL